MAITLRLIREDAGGGLAAEFLLQAEQAVVGRDETCDFVVEEPTVSSRHGMFRRRGHRHEYVDLGSTNGSAVIPHGKGAARVLGPGEPFLLSEGDVLLLGALDGGAKLRVEFVEAPIRIETVARSGTVVARSPLRDLSEARGSSLLDLTANLLRADGPGALALAAKDWLGARFPRADWVHVTVVGSGFSARAGQPVPEDVLHCAMKNTAAMVLSNVGETPVLALAPLWTGRSWHGLLAVGGPTSVHGSREGLTDIAVCASIAALTCELLSSRLLERKEKERLAALAGERLKAGLEDTVEPVGVDPTFQRVVEMCRKVAPSTVPVLIIGETGTGKEVLARAIHRFSTRRQGPFVPVNCAAIPKDLMESELFGHLRGAFSGASNDRNGLFHAAHGGTLLLDEVGELPLDLQPKLLRVLEDGEVRRLGSTRAEHVDVRVVSATNRDLTELVAEGRFRQDLFYRLHHVTVTLPPLRQRRTDIPLLAHYILGKACERHKKRVPGLAPSALQALMSYDFPGNVRELRNIVERAVAFAKPGSPLEVENLWPESPDAGKGHSEGGSYSTLREAVEWAQRQAVLGALEATMGNLSEASRVLGITRPGLYKLMQRLGIERPPQG